MPCSHGVRVAIGDRSTLANLARELRASGIERRSKPHAVGKSDVSKWIGGHRGLISSLNIRRIGAHIDMLAEERKLSGAGLLRMKRMLAVSLRTPAGVRIDHAAFAYHFAKSGIAKAAVERLAGLTRAQLSGLVHGRTGSLPKARAAKLARALGTTVRALSGAEAGRWSAMARLEPQRIPFGPRPPTMSPADAYPPRGVLLEATLLSENLGRMLDRAVAPGMLSLVLDPDWWRLNLGLPPGVEPLESECFFVDPETLRALDIESRDAHDFAVLVRRAVACILRLDDEKPTAPSALALDHLELCLSLFVWLSAARAAACDAARDAAWAALADVLGRVAEAGRKMLPGITAASRNAAPAPPRRTGS